jgi:integrase
MMEARRGLGGVYLRGGVWWVRYSYRGEKRRESSGSTRRPDAVRLLKKRLGEMGQGKLPGADAERVTLADLGRILVDDYGLKGNRTTARAQQSLVHVREHFGENARALDVTADALVGYAMERQRAGAAPATVKNELAALRRAFNLAVRAGRLPQRPAFPIIDARNRRKGFFEDSDFRAVLAHLPPDVAAVAEFLYWTGWRKGEALTLEWRHVDLKAGIIRIDDSKNGEPRTMPFRVLPELAALIDRQRERTSALEQARGIIVPHVFHRDGTPVRSFRRSWLRACVAVGQPHRLPHDFRRTAARNLSRAGVPEQVIMALCGWKTRSVFDRYRIVNEQDLADGLGKLAAATMQPETRRIVTIRPLAAGVGHVGLRADASPVDANGHSMSTTKGTEPASARLTH